MSKIIGNTTATPTPRSDWNQVDETKADFILNKPELGSLATKDVVAKSDLSSDVQTSLGKADVALEQAKSYTDGEVAEATEILQSAINNKENKGTASTAVATHNTSSEAHNDLRLLISALNTQLDNFLDVDDTTKDQLSEVIALIEANSDLIQGITTSKVNVADIINNLTTNVSNKPLSAAQGVVLKGLIDTLQTEVDNHTHTISEVTNLQTTLNGKVPNTRTVNGKPLSSNVTLSASDVGALPDTTSIPDALSDLADDSAHRTVTDTEKATWNAKSNFSGSYNDLTNKPTGLATETYVDSIASEKANKEHKHAINDVTDLQTALDATKVYTDEATVDKAVLATTNTDSSVSYAKTVPENALPYAEVGAVGGMTRKCANLAKPRGDINVNGFTTALNDDGSVTLRGSATAKQDTVIQLIDLDRPADMTASNTYSITVLKDGVNAAKWGCRVDYTDDIGGNVYGWNAQDISRPRKLVRLYLQFTPEVGDTTYNGTYRVMLNSGETALPYEPYFEGLRSAPVTEVESVGVNIWDEEWYNASLNEKTGAFVEGSYVCGKNFIPVLPNTRYYKNTNVWLAFYNKNKAFISAQLLSTSFTTPSECYFMKFQTNSSYGMVYNNDIIIAKGDTALPYTPYVRNSLPIPDEVKALDGYGCGINESVFNYIDWEKKQFVKRVGCVDLGTLSWALNTGLDYTYYATIPNLEIPENISSRGEGILCSRYSITTNFDGASMDDKSMMRHPSGRCFIRDSSYEDSNTFKTSMSGVMLYYELAEPIITDISDLLQSDNLIPVEGGGTVTMVNEYGYAVPSEITFHTGHNTAIGADTLVGNLKGVASKALYAEHTDNASHADIAEKAVQDENGANIASTYETKTNVQTKINDVIAHSDTNLETAKSYVDGLMSGKANTTHTHDDRYYTEAEVDTKLSGKSDTSHNHNSAYDTKGAASSALNDAKAYTDTAKAELVATIDGKANSSDFTSHKNNKSNPHGVTLSQLGVTASAAELNYVDGVTSNIQTQLNTKASATDLKAHTDNKSNPHGVTAAQVGADAKGSAAAVQTNLDVVDDKVDEHVGNETIHVTTTNKTNWNAAHSHSQATHARTDATKVADSTTNGNILINGTETNVYTHPNSGVTAGTYKSVTVNAQGHITAGTNPTTLAGYGITDAETKGAANTALTSAKTYTDTVASGKSDKDHNHDSDYDVKGAANTALASAKAYADSAATTAATNVKNDLLNGAGAAYDTLKELGDLIDDNADAIDALETVAAGKADKTHSHAISDVTNLQTTLDGKAAKSHGTHVSWSTTTPKVNGTATVGSETKVARGDHVHPTDTTRASQVDFDTHVANTTAHITSAERSNWNAAKTHADSAHAPSNAQPNQNAFSNIKVGSTTVAADTTTDTVEFVGSNVTITPDATNDKVTFTVADGSTSAKGIVQLTNSTSSTSTTTAATPNSVKLAYDLANTAKTNAATAQARADAAYTLAEGKADSLSDLGVTATAAELNYVDGVTSNVQTQLDSKVDKVSGKGLSTNDYTTAEKNKLAGIAEGANKTVVDSAISSGSTNPVQNKVITSALEKKSDYSGTQLSAQEAKYYAKICTIDLPKGYHDMYFEFDLAGRTHTRFQNIKCTIFKANTTVDNIGLRVSGPNDNVYKVCAYRYIDTTNGDYTEIWCEVPSWDTLNIIKKTLAANGSIQQYLTWDMSKNTALPTESDTVVKVNASLEKWSGNAATATALTTSAGSATQPVYFKDGKPTATTYTLGKSVPSDAKFTDTTYSNATTSAAGLMSATDKKKVDAVTSCYQLGNMTGKTKADLQTALDTWLNSYCDIPNATASFSASADWATVWNSSDTTKTISAGGQWQVTIIARYSSKAYTQLRISYYSDEQVYYVVRSNSTWSPAHQAAFKDDLTALETNIQTKLDSKLDKSGGTMTGDLNMVNQKIVFDDSESDHTLLQVGEGSWGYRVDYKGTGSGNNNTLVVVADNQQGTEVNAVTMYQDGTTTFAKAITASGGVTGNLKGNADTATKATQDASGNVITSTYATKTAATQSAAGLMSAADKKKLDGIATGATANTGDITGVTAGAGLGGGGTSGTVTLTNSGVRSITQDSNDGHKLTINTGGTNTTITIPDNNTTYSNATTSTAGLMSSSDKSKLDGIASGANKTTVDSSLSSSSTNPVQNKVINTALASKADLVDGKVPSSQLPSYVDDVLEYSAKSSFPATGESGKIYVDIATNKTYRWSGSAYVEISASLAIGTTASTAAAGNHTHSSYVNQNAFSNVKIGDTTIAADTTTDTLTLVAGSNITLTPDATNDKITISATNTTYSAATTSKDGLMSSTDKAKMNYTNIAYGTCTTAAATAAKEITISGNSNWSLAAGSLIVVKFTNTNTASNPTFNVNGTGAKSVWYNTALITTSSLSYAGYASRYGEYMYDGTQYVFIGWSTDSNSTYTPMSLGSGYGTCDTAAATTAKVVTLASYSLQKGGIVSVKFTNAVPANATMNINSKGAKAIFYKGSAIIANVIKAGDTATFVYDGTQYHLLTVDRDENTTYTLGSFGITATAAELNYVDGVTSNIQTQLNNKAAVTIKTWTAADMV